MTCQRCEALEAEVDRIRLAASVDLQNLQAKYLVELRKNGALQAQLDGRAEKAKGSDEVKRICAYWKSRLNHPKAKTPAGGKRWKQVAARLNEGFTEEQLTKAIDGCARKPWVGPHGRQAAAGPGAARHDDLELICRDEATVERFIRYADEQPPEAPIPLPKPRRPRDSDWSYARTDVEVELLRALEAKGCHPVEKAGGWQALCPAHEDRTPSLSVHWNGDESKLLVKCWAGCEVPYVMDALGLPLSALFRSERRAA